VTAERRALAELEALRNAPGADNVRLDTALAIVCRTLNAPLGKVLALRDSGDYLLVRSGIGWRDGVVGCMVVPATNASTAGYALRHPRAVIFNDVQGTARFTDATLLHSHDVRSSVAVRLVADGRPIGVLSVHELSLRRFSDRDATFIEQAASIVADLMRDSRREA